MVTKSGEVTAQPSYQTVFDWAKHNDAERLLLDTLALRVMRMLESAGPYPYFPCIIKHGPSMGNVKKNMVPELTSDRKPLEFTFTFGSRTAKVRTFIESAELLTPRYSGLWLLGGTLAAHKELRPDQRPNLEESVFFAKGYDGRACAGGVIYCTPWMKRGLCEEGKTLI